jgi:hypothetical protein
MRVPSFIPFFGRRTALQRLAAVASVMSSRDAEAEALAVVDELRGASIDKRVKIAREAGLPESATRLGRHARAVFETLIDDDLLREALGVETILTWHAADAPSCVAFAVARVRRFTPELLWQLLPALDDASEIYDVFAPLFRSEAPDRTALMRVPFDAEIARRVFADPRIVDLALETMTKDVRPSCLLLGMNASPRAVEELRALLERVPADDDPWSATEDGALAAIDGLANALPAQAFIDVLAQFLASQPKRLVPHMYLSMRIAQYSIALDQHPLIRDNTSLRWAIAQAVMPPPMPVG